MTTKARSRIIFGLRLVMTWMMVILYFAASYDDTIPAWATIGAVIGVVVMSVALDLPVYLRALREPGAVTSTMPVPAMNTDYRTAAAPCCSRCGASLRELNERLFSADGQVVCAACFERGKLEDRQAAMRTLRRRGTLSFGLLSFTSCFLLVAAATKIPTMMFCAVGLFVITYVVTEVLSPREFRAFWFW